MNRHPLAAAAWLAVACTIAWPLGWDARAAVAIASVSGAELAVWLDRRYSVRRAALERDLARARRENAAAHRELAQAKADLAVALTKERA